MSQPSLLETHDIFDATIRAMVVQLQNRCQQKYDPQTCYYWLAYEDFDADAALRRLQTGGDLHPPRQPNHVRGLPNTGTGVFPLEIWQIICPYLPTDDLKTIRLVNRALADAGAESLISQIRIDTSFESFKRLKQVADHSLIRKGVKKLFFEAGLLANVGCFHYYSRHFDLPHHGKPQPPAQKSDRADRLYARNLAKFERQVAEKYRAYRKLFETQQLLVNGPKEHLFPSADRLVNLREIVFQAGAVCPHNFSKQFINKYCQDCAVPISVESSHTLWQLENILRPGLTRLVMSQISPKLFNGEGGRDDDWLHSIFASLERLHIGFRQHRSVGTADDVASSNNDGQILKTTHLPRALRAAPNLKTLTINFFPSLDMAAVPLENVMPQTSFPNLAMLDLDFFKASEDDLLRMLKAQPKLYWLALANVTLSTGNWASAATKMRRELRVEEFLCGGYLEDPTAQYMSDWSDGERWAEDGDKYTFAMALDVYITDHDDDNILEVYDDEDEFELACNPFYAYDEEYDDPEVLFEQYGPPNDDDDDDDDTSESGPEESDDSDEITSLSIDSGDTDNDDPPSLEDVIPPSPMSLD